MASPVYRSRKPKASPLWQCLFRHFDTFLGQYEERYSKRCGFLRPIIAEVVNKFLDCGDLEHGFARIRCDHCKTDHLLAFSCKGRWFCPSCHQKKVLLFGALLAESILYPVPHRHYTFFQHDEFNNATNTVRIMAERSDPASGLESYTYTSNDIATSSEFNPDGTLFATVDARGLRTEFLYDDLRRLTNAVAGVDDPGAQETSYEYTGNCGSLTLPPYRFMTTKTIDPRGFTTETLYNALNRPIEIKAEISNGVYAITRTSMMPSETCFLRAIW